MMIVFQLKNTPRPILSYNTVARIRLLATDAFGCSFHTVTFIKNQVLDTYTSIRYCQELEGQNKGWH